MNKIVIHNYLLFRFSYCNDTFHFLFERPLIYFRLTHSTFKCFCFSHSRYINYVLFLSFFVFFFFLFSIWKWGYNLPSSSSFGKTYRILNKSCLCHQIHQFSSILYHFPLHQVNNLVITFPQLKNWVHLYQFNLYLKMKNKFS